MSAGHGIEHSEFNASRTDPVHFLQVWIQPDRVNSKPAHAHRAADAVRSRGRWTTVASPTGEHGSLAIRQQAWVRGLVLGSNDRATWPLQPDRRYWLQVATGKVETAGRVLRAGDAVGYVGESGALELAGAGDGLADLILFDLPG
jgi:quercetin 2,3-dioxygenase